jgi:AraC-like DNA-binding protein
MLSGHDFRRIRRQERNRSAIEKSGNRALLALISERVIERFARISEARLAAIPLTVPAQEEFEEPAVGPCHPACVEHDGDDYCRESLQLHLAELGQQPETHWHACDFGRLCAYVPVIYNGRCLAAVKLACPASMSKEVFDRQVELLDVLVRDFVASEADSLDRMLQAELKAAQPDAVTARGPATAPGVRPRHVKLIRALSYIEEHLKEPSLTVRRIAEELDIYPNYLSQLFAKQVGQRLSQFIAGRRIELAKELLATTDWQVKRVARATGHANPRWFSYVFRVFTGLTPGTYRRRLQHHPHPISPERKKPAARRDRARAVRPNTPRKAR